MNTPERPQIVAEDMPAIRAEISIIREQKGMESESLELIRAARTDAFRLGLDEDVVELFWEEYLVGKHLNDMGIMADMARNAGSFIERQGVESKRARNNRFSGEVLMLSGDSNRAVIHFKRGISLYEQINDPTERVNALEFRGFLAEALIYSGQPQEGIELGIKTFEDFDTGDGAKLKTLDYYTWAVWKSGVVIKTWNAVLDTNTELDESEAKELTRELDEAGQLLDVSTEGMPSNFEIRKDEIAKIKQRFLNH